MIQIALWPLWFGEECVNTLHFRNSVNISLTYSSSVTHGCVLIWLSPIAWKAFWFHGGEGWDFISTLFQLRPQRYLTCCWGAIRLDTYIYELFYAICLFNDRKTVNVPVKKNLSLSLYRAKRKVWTSLHFSSRSPLTPSWNLQINLRASFTFCH